MYRVDTLKNDERENESKMKEIIKEEIFRYVRENENNHLSKIEGPYFAKPLVQFASATDELFSQYKEIIAPEHYSKGLGVE